MYLFYIKRLPDQDMLERFKTFIIGHEMVNLKCFKIEKRD